jgi:uncharacterized cupredoxin-like copper-binding protein
MTARRLALILGPALPQGIAKPRETRELSCYFGQAGETLAGCHVAGHYGGGMKAAITVTG